jgi:adenylosuccinate lyase
VVLGVDAFRPVAGLVVLRTRRQALIHRLLTDPRACGKGLGKLEADPGRLAADLDANWEVLAEPIQTVMRRYGIEAPYEKLKELTRGQRVDRERMQAFVRGLDLPEAVREQLLALSPATYIGNAEAQARAI